MRNPPLSEEDLEFSHGGYGQKELPENAIPGENVCHVRTQSKLPVNRLRIQSRGHRGGRWEILFSGNDADRLYYCKITVFYILIEMSYTSNPTANPVNAAA